MSDDAVLCLRTCCQVEETCLACPDRFVLHQSQLCMLAQLLEKGWFDLNTKGSVEAERNVEGQIDWLHRWLCHDARSFCWSADGKCWAVFARYERVRCDVRKRRRRR